MSDIVNALLVVAMCAVAAAIPVWSHRAQRVFYLDYRRTFGPQPRERPWVRWGEALDHEAFGTWDFLPAWRALSASIGDPHLDRERRRALRATVIELVCFFVVGIVGILVIGAFTRSILLGVLPVVAYMGGQLWSSSGAFWLSRPDLEDRQMLGMQAYQTTIVVLAALLIAVFGLTLLLIQLADRP